MRSIFQSREHEPVPGIEPVPTVFPLISGAEIAAQFLGKRLGGDFFDSIRVSPERVLVGLLDIAGRREDNRNLLTVAQDVFRNEGARLFAQEDINESNAMIELNLHINRALIEASQGVRSCPAFIACYHEKLGTLCYTNAGHTPAFLRDHTGIARLDSTGLPLGLFSHATSDARIVGVENGAALLLVSRGVVDCEAANSGSSDEFGLERVRQFLADAPITTAKNLCTSILNSVNEFTGESPLCDDRTVLALVRTA